MPEPKKKAPRYTPVSKRQNRPDAIAWVVKNHPEISDAQISKLLGTTKTTIQAIRDRSHWNAANLEPQDPVGLGLCSQIDLDLAVVKAEKKRAKMEAENPALAEGPSLLPAEETVPAAAAEAGTGEIDADKVFANFEKSE